MAMVVLSDEPGVLCVGILDKHQRAGLRLAFQQTQGSVDPTTTGGLDTFVVPLARVADIRALWSAEFEWEPRAMAAAITRLLALAEIPG